MILSIVYMLNLKLIIIYVHAINFEYMSYSIKKFV